MKKKFKIVFNLILVIILLSIFTTSSIATNGVYVPPSTQDVLNGASSFINEGVNSSTMVPRQETILGTSNLILNIIFTIGIVILIVWGMILGITFITGSIQQQADVKKGLFPFAVGAVILFSFYTIWKIVVTIVSNFT